MANSVFTWPVHAGEEGQHTSRVRQAQFGDGYMQTSADGLNPTTQSWPITTTGTKAEIMAARQFLKDNAGRSFIWESPVGELGFYRCNDFGVANIGGGVFVLRATFEESFQP